MIYYGCPKCQEAMASPESMAGQAETCPACGNVAMVPKSNGECMFPQTPAAPPRGPRPYGPRSEASRSSPVTRPGGLSVLGLISVIFGSLACLTAWMPVLGLLTLPVSLLGIGFGLVGFLLARKGSSRLPLAGIFICAVAITLGLACGSLGLRDRIGL